MHRRPVVAILTVALAALPVLVPALPSGAVTASGAYVALGDSYAAGPLIPNQVHSACLRSDHNYPSLVAAALQVSSFRDATCSGATTNDMANGQQTNAYTSVPPQFDALGPDAGLVSVTIGGNDIGFANVALTCAVVSLLNLFGSPCRDHYTQGGTDSLAAAIAATAPKVAAVLHTIHQRSPRAKVLVVGYLNILPVAGNGCWPVMPIAMGDLPYLRGVEEQLNQMLATQAGLNQATFVDTYTPTVGHDVCQLPGVKWVEGIVPTSPAYPVHPNALGMQADATAVLAALH